jgi:hypothetical protein
MTGDLYNAFFLKIINGGIKMKKSTVLLYSVIAIAVLLLITVSIFFGQKRYY